MNFLEQFFSIVTAVMIILGTCTNYGDQYLPQWFVQLWRYGRANKSPGKMWIVKTIEVPKSWFAHFYLYAVLVQSLMLYTLVKIYTDSYPMEAASSSWLGKILNIVGGPDRSLKVDSTTTILASFLFLLHVLRRVYECWCVSVYSGTKMNLMHYFLAFFHYAGCALSIVAHSVGFATESSLFPTGTPDIWTLSLNTLNIFHVWGLFLFLYGSFEQFRAHRQYADLRKSKENQVVSLAHRIPSGGLFEKISCPNYWAEIIIYASLCVLFGFTNPTWNSVFIWVLTNQIVSGTMNHKWYLRTFPDYPKSRKAVIPYVW